MYRQNGREVKRVESVLSEDEAELAARIAGTAKVTLLVTLLRPESQPYTPVLGERLPLSDQQGYIHV